LIFFRHFVELPAKNQPLLDYIWDISRDWERLQGRQLCMGDCHIPVCKRHWSHWPSLVVIESIRFHIAITL